MIESGYVAEYETLTYERRVVQDSDAAAKRVQRQMIYRAVSITVVTALIIYYAPGHILALLARGSTINWGYTPPALPDLHTIALVIAAVSATIAVRQIVRLTRRAGRTLSSAAEAMQRQSNQPVQAEVQHDG